MMMKRDAGDAMIEMLGARQRELLTLLLHNKDGMTVDGLADGMGVTRTAVRQHLAVLEHDQLVTRGTTRPTGGRPEHLYVLTQKGSEAFPRQYSWFARMLLDLVVQELGEEGTGDRLAAAGARVAEKLAGNLPAASSGSDRVDALGALMQELGYDVNPPDRHAANTIPVIEANNCVFHDLAAANPQVCRFDLALISTFTGSTVLHEECMAAGGHVCRFRLLPKHTG